MYVAEPMYMKPPPISSSPAPASGGLPSDFWYWISAPPATVQMIAFGVNER